MTRRKGIVERRPEMTDKQKRRFSDRLNRLFDQEQYEVAEKLLEDALARYPEDHFLLIRLGDAVHEQRRYRRALGFYRKAGAQMPKCPLVLWGASCVYESTGDVEGARRLLRALARMKPEVLGKQPCGEGIPEARGLIADANFRLGKLAEREGAKAVARRRYQAYLRLTERPSRSTESRKAARARLRALDGASTRKA